MKVRRRRDFGTGVRLRTGAVVSFLALSSILPGGALGADPRIPESRGLVDYFTAGRDRRATEMVANVEQFHMGPEKFQKDFAERRYGSALNELRFVLIYVPNHPRALHLMGETCHRSGDLFYPIRYFERAIRLFPQYAYTRAQYGNYLVSIGQIAPGIGELRRAVAADSTLTVARAWLHEAESKAAAMRSDAP